MMKIGILGGTFNPVHNAHIKMAKAACDSLGLEHVLIIPVPNPPHKQDKDILSYADRCNMVKLAAQEDKRLVFSDFESGVKGPAYSAETIVRFKKENPDVIINYIIGGDSLINLKKWYKPEILLKNVILTTVFRAGNDINAYLEQINMLKDEFACEICIVDMPCVDISSTEIRAKVECGMDISTDTPKSVAEYIYENGLYRNERYEKIQYIKSDLKTIQDEPRFRHTIGVAETAFALAKHYNCDMYTSYLAGLLHDCAKTFSDKEKRRMCKERDIPISRAEDFNSFLLHAKVGEITASEKYHIDDADVLNAIRYHTTGRAAMSLLEKIIFVADYIEPGRKTAPNLDFLRKNAYTDIDETVYFILRDTLDYLMKVGRDNIDTHTVEAHDFYEYFINKNK